MEYTALIGNLLVALTIATAATWIDSATMLSEIVHPEVVALIVKPQSCKKLEESPPKLIRLAANEEQRLLKLARI